jgi:beta-glucanase (GH16 family)
MSLLEIKVKLGLFPSAEKAEMQRDALLSEYRDFVAYAESKELSRFEYLTRHLQSDEFEKRENNLEAGEVGIKSLKKEFSDFQRKGMEKCLESKALVEKFRSEELSRFEYLTQYLHSSKFEKRRSELDAIQSEIKSRKSEFRALQRKGLEKYFTSKASAEIFQSEKLPRFEYLTQYLHSNEFEERENNPKTDQAEIKSLKKELHDLQHSEELKKYFKFKNLAEKIQPEELPRFEYLTQHLHSNEFEKKEIDLETGQAEIKSLKKELRDLQHSEDLKQYFKAKTLAEKFQPEEMSRFEYLTQYLHSNEFEKKAQAIETDRTEVESLKKEHRDFRSDKDLQKYLKFKSQEEKFASITNWKLLFADDFSGKKLDTDKWLTRFYWGDKILDCGYSMEGDRHCTTDGKNISVSSRGLSIETRIEKAAGIGWDTVNGFKPVDFAYTSGTINTGKSFRHQYGKIEAKVKVPVGEAYHAFWLAGDKMLPQVTIFKYIKGKFYLGNFWQSPNNPEETNKNSQRITGIFAGEKSCIFSLEWTKERLSWSINDVHLITVSHGIPDEPMYLAFASGVSRKAQQLSQPVALEIEWVRFYSK